ncbi:MAG: PAS domain S-box protein, partial [Deltaproteobacteria bacterium]|nr:PAS domain S-box protein [Deltaproteobacteria bacterium]
MNRESQGLAAILDAMEDGIYIVNQDFIVEYMNKAMIRDFGEGVGRRCHQVIMRSDEICPWCSGVKVFKPTTLHRQLHIPTTDKVYNLIESTLRNQDDTVSKLSIYKDIAHETLREDTSQSLEDDYTRLFESVGCCVYVSSKEGKFLNANQALLQMLGYDSKEEFLNMDLNTDLYVRPQDRRKFQEMIEQDGQVIDYEVDFKRKGGETRAVLLTAHVRYSETGKVLGYEGIMVDQSLRKKMENELREANSFLNNIIQSSPNAIIATDLAGVIIIWNSAAREMLGHTAQDVVGKMNIRNIYAERMGNKVKKLLNSSAHGGMGKLTPYPISYATKDGEIVEGSQSAAIIYDENGKEVATVNIIVDLEERLEMERKLRQTQEQLLQSEKLAAMGRLTSQVAHELNNPLYGIMNTLELMKTEISPTNKRRKILEMALSETVRLTELLRKMLSFSKPDQEERQPTDVFSLLDEILLLYEKQLREHSIRISTFFEENSVQVFASKNQLRQVFLNLIANARDAMPEGGTLTLRTTLNGDFVRIEVSDTGVGIREENLNKIFDAFFTTKDNV